MDFNAKSIRPFIGSKDFDTSRNFYRDLGFTESIIDSGMSYFYTGAFGFYLQKYYAKEWVENTMLFMEVSDVETSRAEIHSLGLDQKYEGVRLSDVRYEAWGKEFFLHDPAGILWHFGAFTKG